MKKYILIKIGDAIVKGKAVAYYKNGTVRIEYPCYHNGFYNGYIASTISADDIMGEW